MAVWPSSLDGPFTRAEGLQAGLTDWDLRSSRCRRVLPNVYVAATTPDSALLHARAALRVAPRGAVLARRTAAELWGGVVAHAPEVDLALAPGTRLRVTGIDARVRAVGEVAWRHGVPLTSPAQTFRDLAGELDLVELVVLGDSLVRREETTPGALLHASAGQSTNGRRARRAAGLVRRGVDSPMESRLRLLLVLAGLPEPVVNHPLRDDTGRVRYRLDLAYPQWRVAVEYDGRQHAENTAQWRWDVQRREDLDAEGWRLVVVLSGDLYRSPARTLERVVAAARSQGGSLATRGEEWRRFFPGRD
jgi:hypothetical protein